MCVGVPMRLLSVDGIAGRAEGPEGIELIDLSLCAEAVPGDWVLNFLGAARAVIEMEVAYSGQDPYKWLGRYLHFLVSKAN